MASSQACCQAQCSSSRAVVKAEEQDLAILFGHPSLHVRVKRWGERGRGAGPCAPVWVLKSACASSIGGKGAEEQDRVILVGHSNLHVRQALGGKGAEEHCSICRSNNVLGELWWLKWNGQG